ncbi:MAG: YkgJ family cysteine cluster protein [Haloarculaceae archaeon]
MKRLEAELAEAHALDVGHLADAIESIGFECTRCGACCRAVSAGADLADDDGADPPDDDGPERPGGDGADPHTATVFPDEVRRLVDGSGETLDADYDWRDVARPMPYGLDGGADDGDTFEWALQTDVCGDCTFYREGEADAPGACTVHGDRPLVCQTYPFSVGAVERGRRNDDEGGGTGGLGTTEPMGGLVEREGMVRAHECEGLGRDISREDAAELAATLKERAIRELEEAIGVRDTYEPAAVDGLVVHDSEGPKRPDGSRLR